MLSPMNTQPWLPNWSPFLEADTTSYHAAHKIFHSISALEKSLAGQGNV